MNNHWRKYFSDTIIVTNDEKDNGQKIDFSINSEVENGNNFTSNKSTANTIEIQNTVKEPVPKTSTDWNQHSEIHNLQTNNNFADLAVIDNSGVQNIYEDTYEANSNNIGIKQNVIVTTGKGNSHEEKTILVENRDVSNGFSNLPIGVENFYSDINKNPGINTFDNAIAGDAESDILNPMQHGHIATELDALYDVRSFGAYNTTNVNAKPPLAEHIGNGTIDNDTLNVEKNQHVTYGPEINVIDKAITENSESDISNRKTSGSIVNEFIEKTDDDPSDVTLASEEPYTSAKTIPDNQNPKEKTDSRNNDENASVFAGNLTSEDENSRKPENTEDGKTNTSTNVVYTFSNPLLNKVNFIPPFLNPKNFGVTADLNEEYEDQIHPSPNSKADTLRKTKNEAENSSQRSNLFNEILWWCAGVNAKVLRKYPNDYAKHAGVGGTVLFTSFMAMLTGGYAFYTVFKSTTAPVAISAFLGIFWGLLIFNLDRYIVSTVNYSENKKTIIRFFTIAPRLLIAILLGIVISTPLELQLFKGTIKAEMYLTNSAQAEKDNKNRYEFEIRERESLIVDRDSLKKNITEYNELYKKFTEKADSQLRGIKYLPGPGNVYKNDTANRNAYNSKYIEAKNQKDQIQKKIDSLAKVIGSGKTTSDSIMNQNESFLAQIEALSSLSEKHPTTRYTKLFITLLIMFLEISPILFKLLTSSGEYEMEITRLINITKLTESQKEKLAKSNESTNIEIAENLNKHRSSLAQNASTVLSPQIKNTQNEIIEKVVNAWKNEELTKTQIPI